MHSRAVRPILAPDIDMHCGSQVCANLDQSCINENEKPKYLEAAHHKATKCGNVLFCFVLVHKYVTVQTDASSGRVGLEPAECSMVPCEYHSTPQPESVQEVIL